MTLSIAAACSSSCPPPVFATPGRSAPRDYSGSTSATVEAILLKDGGSVYRSSDYGAPRVCMVVCGGEVKHAQLLQQLEVDAHAHKEPKG